MAHSTPKMIGQPHTRHATHTNVHALTRNWTWTWGSWIFDEGHDKWVSLTSHGMKGFFLSFFLDSLFYFILFFFRLRTLLFLLLHAPSGLSSIRTHQIRAVVHASSRPTKQPKQYCITIIEPARRTIHPLASVYIHIAETLNIVELVGTSRPQLVTIHATQNNTPSGHTSDTRHETTIIKHTNGLANGCWWTFRSCNEWLTATEC